MPKEKIYIYSRKTDYFLLMDCESRESRNPNTERKRQKRKKRVFLYFLFADIYLIFLSLMFPIIKHNTIIFFGYFRWEDFKEETSFTNFQNNKNNNNT